MTALHAGMVAAGGAAGALARWLLATAVHGWLGRGFPWGTLAVNVVGSFAMGLLAVLLIERMALGPAWRAGLLVGFLGAFTTFSTYAFETGRFLEQGRPMLAVANLAMHNVVGVALAMLGVLAGRAYAAA